MLKLIFKFWKAGYEQGLADGRYQVLKEEILRQEILAKNDDDFNHIKRLLLSYEKPERKKIKYEEPNETLDA